MADHQIFLSTEVLSWTPRSQTTCMADDSEWKTPYKYWQHADSLLSHANNEHFLIDCIGNLKRAIDHRLKRLSSLYLFKRIPDPSKPPDLLDTLEHYGIVRPMMVREISQVRNLLEHHYKSPPSHQRCQELVDFSWYFLRSTDSLCTRLLEDYILHLDSEKMDSSNWLEVTYGPTDNWHCSIRGWVPDTLISAETKLGITIQLERLETFEEFTSRTNADNSPLKPYMPDSTYLIGNVVGPPEAFTAMTATYFSTL